MDIEMVKAWSPILLAAIAAIVSITTAYLGYKQGKKIETQGDAVRKLETDMAIMGSNLYKVIDPGHVVERDRSLEVPRYGDK